VTLACPPYQRKKKKKRTSNSQPLCSLSHPLPSNKQPNSSHLSKQSQTPFKLSSTSVNDQPFKQQTNTNLLHFASFNQTTTTLLFSSLQPTIKIEKEQEKKRKRKTGRIYSILIFHKIESRRNENRRKEKRKEGKEGENRVERREKRVGGRRE